MSVEQTAAELQFANQGSLEKSSRPAPISPTVSARVTVQEIAKRLEVGRPAVYALLERGYLPAVRIGRRWLITRQAYELWERTCGTGCRRQPGGNV